jgi:hypothetical protein
VPPSKWEQVTGRSLILEASTLIDMKQTLKIASNTLIKLLGLQKAQLPEQ